MADLTVSQIRYAVSLLAKYHVTIVDNVADDLKCGLCKNVLVDAQLTECGCNFCKQCIDGHINDGHNCCPGNSNDCPSNDLSNVLVDNKINRQIAALKVRCDEGNCGFQVELSAIERHLETCPGKKRSCPFRIVGCEEQFARDEMIRHLQMESFKHSQSLVDLVESLRSEIGQLKVSDERHRCEIAGLQEDLERRNHDGRLMEENHINSIKETLDQIQLKDIESLKKKREDFLDEILKDHDEKYKHLLNLITENRDGSKKEIEELKKRNETSEKTIEQLKESNTSKDENIETLKKEIDLLKLQMEASLPNKRCMQENIDSVKNELDKVRAENQGEQTRLAVIQIERFLDVQFGVFVWQVGNIENFTADQYICSDYFCNRNNLYKMGLVLRRSGNECTIRFVIYRGSDDSNLEWPFGGNVMVKISDKFDANKRRSISKDLNINRPIERDYDDSSVFVFYQSDLSSIGLWTNSNCVVECFIDQNL